MSEPSTQMTYRLRDVAVLMAAMIVAGSAGLSAGWFMAIPSPPSQETTAKLAPREGPPAQASPPTVQAPQNTERDPPASEPSDNRNVRVVLPGPVPVEPKPPPAAEPAPPAPAAAPPAQQTMRAPAGATPPPPQTPPPQQIERAPAAAPPAPRSDHTVGVSAPPVRPPDPAPAPQVAPQPLPKAAAVPPERTRVQRSDDQTRATTRTRKTTPPPAGVESEQQATVERDEQPKANRERRRDRAQKPRRDRAEQDHATEVREPARREGWERRERWEPRERVDRGESWERREAREVTREERPVSQGEGRGFFGLFDMFR